MTCGIEGHQKIPAKALRISRLKYTVFIQMRLITQRLGRVTYRTRVTDEKDDDERPGNHVIPMRILDRRAPSCFDVILQHITLVMMSEKIPRDQRGERLYTRGWIRLSFPMFSHAGARDPFVNMTEFWSNDIKSAIWWKTSWRRRRGDM
jgi:hypothetical protein